MVPKREAEEPLNRSHSAFAVARSKRERLTSIPVETLSPKPLTASYDENEDFQAFNVPRHGEPDRNTPSESEIEVEAGAQPTTPLSLSTWHPDLRNIVNSGDDAELSMCKGDTIAILGQYGLQVKLGTVEVYGAVLKQSASTYVVSAPTTHALPCILCSSSMARILVKSRPQQLRKLGTLSPLFHRIWNHGGFKTETAEIGGPYSSFCFIPSTTSDPLKRSIFPLLSNQPRDEAIDKLCSMGNGRVPTILICGSQATGKSTLGRLVSNRLVTTEMNFSRLTPHRTTFLLDLDPGQAEFSPPGQISLTQIRRPLLGPSFTHPCTGTNSSARLIRAHALAALSPKVNPVHFLDAASQLMHEYHCALGQYPGTPLVINCPGWITGSGLEILMQFIRKWSPSDIVYLSNGNRDDSQIRAALEQAAGNSLTHFLREPIYKSPSKTSAQLRAMQTMSYFHSDGIDDTGNIEWNAVPITSTKPWMVSYGEEAPGIRGIMLYGETVPPECLKVILEGCLVSIVSVEDESVFSSLRSVRTGEAGLEPDVINDDARFNVGSNNHLAYRSSKSSEDSPWPRVKRTPDEGLPYILTSHEGENMPLDPWKSQTLGQAIVQAIDVPNQTLHLITPLSEVTIQNLQSSFEAGKSSIVLVRGRWDTPAWAYTEELWRANYRSSRDLNKSVSTDRDGSDEGGSPELDDYAIANDAGEQWDDLEIPFVDFEASGNQ
ncbi:hypothetical protein EV356DRAFT_528022 [Viridothelium virens]|uniref:Polynucleotide 5'-hydroxyl-kinase GRC3 n=1 Tax=Viridothelium virens TaxID=1048519 RepID=A0A6A6HPE5_VIRVR|nr:hypothetical protein EV356DRAFT_528022 [Viridothelium virens]